MLRQLSGRWPSWPPGSWLWRGPERMGRLGRHLSRRSDQRRDLHDELAAMNELGPPLGGQKESRSSCDLVDLAAREVLLHEITPPVHSCESPSAVHRPRTVRRVPTHAITAPLSGASRDGRCENMPAKELVELIHSRPRVPRLGRRDGCQGRATV